MTIDDAIRQRSYLIWKREGCPEGRNLEHWLQAKAELEAEPKPAKTRRPRAAAPVANSNTPLARRTATRKASGA